MNKGRKTSGGKYHALRKKRLHEHTGQARNTFIGDNKTKQLKKLGGKKKTVLLKANIANVLVDGKTKKVEIIKVLETPQNSFLARQNRILKSAIIETSAGKARITNRPTQEGQVNAVLIKE